MNKAERFWDNIAETFDKKEKRFEKISSETIELIKRFLEPGNIVLDYGCAMGTKTLILAGHVKMIQGIDISSKMIEGAKRKATEQKAGNVDFVHTTLFDKKLKKGSFDVVLALNIMHTIKERRQTVVRIDELLKPDGLFISLTPCLKEKMAFMNYIQFSVYFLLIRFGLQPDIFTRFKIPDLENLVKSENFQIVETAKLYHKGTSYLIVAKKIEPQV